MNDKDKIGESHDSTLSERQQTQLMLLDMMKNTEFAKKWPAKRLALELWGLCKELRQEYQGFDEFWALRSKTLRRIRTGEIDGYDYGVTYYGLKLFLQSLASNAGKQLRTYNTDIFSDQPFSSELRNSLKRFNDELNFLTIEQIRALEASTKHRHLWIQGPAGTGKTIFAIEAAYRALRAGSSVLIVYRSRQFEQVFAKLLKNVSQQLNLLLHLDFMYLQRLQEQHAIESEAFIKIARELLPNTDFAQKPLFDLLIVDDCGTYETQMPFLIKYAENFSYRQIFLAAPEQIIDKIIYEFGSKHISGNDEIDDVVSQVLTAPAHYKLVTLKRNIRNAGDIVAYANSLFKLDHSAGIMEAGKTTRVNIDWSELDKTLLAVCTELLDRFPPDRIRILVDPGISYPDLDVLPPHEHDELHEELLNQMPPLAGAVLRASRNCGFLNSTFECEEEKIEELSSMIVDKKTCFIYTDGESLGALTELALDHTPHADDFMRLFERWSSPDIDAKAILLPDAIIDPLQIKNSILIYPVPLYIGLESDVVIYIRNQVDHAEKQAAMDPSLKKKIKKLRSAHHFLGMSRAKYHLVDIKIN